MTTARDLITAALEDVGVIGVGQTPLAEDINGGLVRLNRMIAQWQRKRWLIYHLLDVHFVSTGAQSYTVGPGGNFNIPRPDRLENGNFFRQNFGGSDFNHDYNHDFGGSSVRAIDYPLTLIEARESYNLIAMKRLSSWPEYIWYDPANPLGIVYIYPVPLAGQFELHLAVKDTLQSFVNLTTAVTLPPEYEEALEYNLAVRFAVKYQIELDGNLGSLAQSALDTIRAANTQVPFMQVPPEVTPQPLVGYNVYSDRYG